MKKDTAVTKLETNTLPTALQGGWGTENVEAKDILIPRIFLAQKMSEVVDKNDVKAGQFYKSTDKSVIGGLKINLDILILSFFKTWTIEVKKNEKFEFETVKPYFPSEASLEWEFEENGVSKRRNETYNFYVIPTSEIEKGEVMPALLSFRRTQASCAKAILTYMKLMQNYRTPACTYVIELTSEIKENDFGSFHVPMMKQGRKATVDEMTVCKQWYDVISAGAVKVDNETGEVS